jgi:hypothetical protein
MNAAQIRAHAAVAAVDALIVGPAGIDHDATDRDNLLADRAITMQENITGMVADMMALARQFDLDWQRVMMDALRRDAHARHCNYCNGPTDDARRDLWCPEQEMAECFPTRIN